jgi:GT2 family glycosyltransferase
LKHLVDYLDSHETTGIATGKLLSADGLRIDSTGDFYSVWGLPWPRGRGETDLKKYDGQTEIFGASGGASLYRVKMLAEVGLFDEAFFAYYEDVDLSFRAQLAGWKVAYEPTAVAYHQISATSNRIRGFATYQTIKNLPLLWLKNVPRPYLFKVGWRLLLAQTLFFGRAITRGHAWSALKGSVVGLWLLPGALNRRRAVQRAKKVGDDYICRQLVHDLPPNARALRKLRSFSWKLAGKKL